MKKPAWESSPGALLALLSTKRRSAQAHLLTVRLRDGTLLRWTDWRSDLAVNGKTFRAPCPTQGRAAAWVTATFGRTTAGNYEGDWGTTDLSVSRFTLPRAGRILRLKFLAAQNLPTVRARGYVFAAGSYNAQSGWLDSVLVAETAELVGVTGSYASPVWHSLDFAAPVDVPAGDYDLGLFASSGIPTLDYSPGLYRGWGTSDYPNPINVGEPFGSAVPTLRERAIYAEYEYLTTEE